MPRFEEDIKHMIRRSVGSTFWRTKTITSSAITTAAIDLTTTATGRLLVRNIIVKADATGLAGGTNFEIKSNNAKGVANIFVETVANLGANTTKAMNGGGINADTTTSDMTPSVTSLPTVIEPGKKLQYDTTGSAGTGAGTIDVHVQFERIDENADIQAA